MASVTIEQLLERANEFELRLERRYAELRDNTKDNGVKLLTYYLSRHRRHLERALSGISPEELRRAKSVRLKVDLPFPEEEPESFTTPVDSVHGGDLLAAAVEYDQKLVGLYKSIIDQPVGEEVARLIGSLVTLEEKDIVMLKKMIAMNYF